MRLISYDCEVFAYDWLVTLKDKETGVYTCIWNDNEALKMALSDDCIYVGFNSKHYDQYIIKAIAAGFAPEEIKKVNDFIIAGGQGWQCPLLDGIYFRFSNVDIRDDTQQGLSLKAIEGHLGMSVKESSVPFDIDRPLTPEEKAETEFYCKHDVDTAERLIDIRKDYLKNKINLGRLAGLDEVKAILGLNPWSTAFEMWCAITKTYEKPFEDTIYTVAGKTIEPKQARYMEQSYGMDIVRPSDVWGEDYFNKTWGDFFPESKHLGGMWDYLMKGEDGKTIEAVLEMKTTKRAEDWQNDVPEYYALQAALYAYLYGVDDVIMVASFLDEKDYKDPAAYQPTASNTITVEFKVSERYPDFADKVAAVEQWWVDYVDTGISPEYDEKKDAEILAALRTNTLSPETDIEALIAEAEGLKKELDEISASTADKEKRLKTINDIIKEHAMGQFRDGDKKVEVKGSTYGIVPMRTDTLSDSMKSVAACQTLLIWRLLCWEVISNARAFRDTQRSCHYGRGLILEDVSD